MTAAQEPRVLDDDNMRQAARHVRNRQWSVLEKMAEHGTIWICWWDKKGVHKNRENRPADLVVCSLISGMELAHWFRSHEDWLEMGDWDEARYAMPTTITGAGRQALTEREKYDMEPVVGGLVEPGWQAVPAEEPGPQAGAKGGEAGTEPGGEAAS